MRKIFSYGLFFAVIFLFAGHNHALTIFNAENIHRAQLDNGFSVVTKAMPDSSVTALDVWIKTGTLHEDEKNSGVSHFVEHMLFQGTQTKDGADADIEKEIESLGGEVNAGTSMDFIHVFVTVPSTQTDFAVDRVLDLVFFPSFPDARMEMARDDLMNELKQKRDDAKNDVFFALREALYTKHPYRFPVVGREDTLQKLNRGDIVSYYEAYFKPENMSLVAVGNFDSQELLQKVKDYFTSRTFKFSSSAHPIQDPGDEPPVTSVRRVRYEKDAPQAYIAVGFHAPSVKDRPDVYAMDLILTLLGEGKTSRLYADLKEKKKLVSEIDCDFLTQKYPGLFVVTAGAQAKDAEKVEKEILSHIAELTKKTVTKEELQKANRILESMVAFDSETPAGQASFLGFYETVDTLDFALTYMDEVKKITPETIKKVAQKYFKKNNYAVVVAAPPGEKDGQQPGKKKQK